MYFQPFYLSCLAHASYLIASDGEAAVVDPQRDVDQYIDEAAKHGLRIRYVLETHLHADFVSGHRELAERAGAEIVMGAKAGALFPHRAIVDGDVLPLGSIELRALETPGHTPEGISWVVVEEGRAVKVLTGDTLFIGDVGRPDLAGGKGYTPQAMAAMLYDSIHTKLLALPDDVEVWPAHGAGSACGKNMSKERSSTIGIQRRTNHALQPMSLDAFVNMMTTDLDAPPRYFPRDAELNRAGARPLAAIETRMLDADEALALMREGALVLDVRDAADFGAAHVDGAINIALSGQFASWCGTLLSPDLPLIVFAADEKRAREAVMRLARVGMENVAGCITSLDGLPQQSLPQIDPSALANSELRVLDVRRIAEYSGGHVPNAANVPLHELDRRMGEIERDAPLAVICAGGYRSSAAASLLARAGFRDLFNVVGGTAAWVAAGYEVAR